MPEIKGGGADGAHITLGVRTGPLIDIYPEITSIPQREREREKLTQTQTRTETDTDTDTDSASSARLLQQRQVAPPVTSVAVRHLHTTQDTQHVTLPTKHSTRAWACTLCFGTEAVCLGAAAPVTGAAADAYNLNLVDCIHCRTPVPSFER
jgi:hypothetical protein